MDHRDAKTYKTQKEADAHKDTESSLYWWQAAKDVLGSKTLDAARGMRDASDARSQSNLRHARLYENVELHTITGADISLNLVRQTLVGNANISLNVVASAIDTLCAKISKNKPRPSFVTSGGDYTQRRMTKRLDKFMRGVFYETKIHNVAQEVFRDACVFGTGILHVFWNSSKRLEVERVIPEEIYVDENDALYQKPTSMFRRKLVSRAVLCDAFPDKAEGIMSLGPASERINGPRPTDMVEVWEGWHKPSMHAEDGGRHVIVVENGCVLLDEDMKHGLPFIILRAKSRVAGFWGKGDAETLTGLQLELNRLIRSITEQLRRKGRGRTFVPMGSKVEPAHLTNGFGDIIKYAGGVPPTVDNGSVISQDEFAQVDRIYSRAMEEVGVSMLSVAGKKPPGVDAAVALREYSEIESERFALRHLAWEQFFLDFSELAICMCEEAATTGYTVKVPGRRRAESVDFKDINLKRDSYVIQMFPVSSLPQTPAARYQRVKEMQADGFLSPPAARALLDFPDIEAEEQLGNAAIDDANATIAMILEEDTPKQPELEPYQDYQLLLERATSAFLSARHQKCEEERLEMLRILIDEVSARVAELQAPPPMPGMPGMEPPAAPAAPADPMAGPVPPPMP